MLGEKYNLPSIDIFNDNGTISEAAGMYVGMDRFDVRKQICIDLEKAGLLEKVEDYTNKVGFSERTNVPIEPKLSMQWFLKMEHLAQIALEPVMKDEIKFYPAKYKNTYRHWMENIKDWCISRQLWWGHRIPAYYLPQGGFVVAETAEKALELAKGKTGDANLTAADLRQDKDALDTWFSSWLWPISLFDGINHPGNEGTQLLLPHVRPRNSSGHHLLLGSAHDHGRLRIRREDAVQERVLHRYRARQTGTQDEQVVG